jgi:hypothetical protein
VPVIITNDELWEQTNEVKITEQITRRKWNWIGHTLRKENAIDNEALEWNTGINKRGRHAAAGREQYERKLWLLGRRGGKLSKSTRTV